MALGIKQTKILIVYHIENASNNINTQPFFYRSLQVLANNQKKKLQKGFGDSIAAMKRFGNNGRLITVISFNDISKTYRYTKNMN
jgi:hypothetical protein